MSRRSFGDAERGLLCAGALAWLAAAPGWRQAMVPTPRGRCACPPVARMRRLLHDCWQDRVCRGVKAHSAQSLGKATEPAEPAEQVAWAAHHYCTPLTLLSRILTIRPNYNVHCARSACSGVLRLHGVREVAAVHRGLHPARGAALLWQHAHDDQHHVAAVHALQVGVAVAPRPPGRLHHGGAWI